MMACGSRRAFRKRAISCLVLELGGGQGNLTTFKPGPLFVNILPHSLVPASVVFWLVVKPGAVLNFCGCISAPLDWYKRDEICSSPSLSMYRLIKNFHLEKLHIM